MTARAACHHPDGMKHRPGREPVAIESSQPQLRQPSNEEAKANLFHTSGRV